MTAPEIPVYAIVEQNKDGKILQYLKEDGTWTSRMDMAFATSNHDTIVAFHGKTGKGIVARVL